MNRKPTAAFAVALGAITLIGPLAVHLFLPAIPVVKADLGVSDALAQLTFSIALMTMAVSTLVYGALADRYGRRPMLLSGLALFVAGSAASAVAPEIWSLVAARMVQAAGAGCSLTLVRAIARDTYGQDRLVTVISYLMMVYTMGPILSPVAGGLMIDAYGWRAVFYVSLVAGVAVLVAAVLLVPESRPRGDVSANGPGMVAVFADLFSRLRFNAFVFQTGLGTGAFLVTATASAYIMKETLGRPATEFGLLFTLFPSGFLCGTVVASRIGSRVSIETIVLVGSSIIAAAVALQIVMLGSGHVTPMWLAIPAFVLAFGQGLALPSSQAGAIATAPQHAGTAAGVGVFVQMLVAGLAVQVYGLAADGTLLPLLLTTGVCAAATWIAGMIPFALARRTGQPELSSKRN